MSDLKIDDIIPVPPVVNEVEDPGVNPEISPEDPTDPAAATSGGSTLSAEEIEKLVSDNMKLAYHYAHQYRNVVDVSRGVSQEDVIQQALAGLVKAANTYNPEKGHFASYAGTIIRNYLGHVYHKGKKHKDSEKDVLDAPVGGGEDDEGDMHDKTGSGNPTADHDVSYDEARLLIQKEIASISQPARDMVQRWMSGESYRDMQNDFGISFAQIGNIVRSELGKLKARLAAKGINSLRDILPESLEDITGPQYAEMLVREVDVFLKTQALDEVHRNVILNA